MEYIATALATALPLAVAALLCLTAYLVREEEWPRCIAAGVGTLLVFAVSVGVGTWHADTWPQYQLGSWYLLVVIGGLATGLFILTRD